MPLPSLTGMAIMAKHHPVEQRERAMKNDTSMVTTAL